MASPYLTCEAFQAICVQGMQLKGLFLHSALILDQQGDSLREVYTAAENAKN